MHTLFCNFETETDFFEELKHSGTQMLSFLTLSPAKIRVFESVSVRMEVENVNVSNRLKGRVIRRKPSSIHSGKNLYEYTVRLDSEDKVWFNAFKNEVEMLSAFQISMPA